jgi:glucose-1-phosphate thymidylyltransferase
VGDPDRYGVAAIDEKQVVQIEEKPENPQSNYAVIGYYMYDYKIFDVIRGITPSKRGELEITSVNNRYIELGELEYGVLEGDWTDASTFESWQFANELMLGRR